MANEAPTPDKPKAARGAPVRLLGWAGGATLALGVLALTLQTEAGSERLQTALSPADPPQVVAKAEPAPERDAENKRLEALVLALAADRERQSARIASLERNLEDMTGSIKQQVATAAKAITPPPAPAPVAVAPVIAPLAMAAVSPPASGGWPGQTQTPQAQPQAAPTAAATTPPAPERLAALPAAEPTAEPPRKPEIGIDLGGAATMDVLNARWVAVKANYGPMLSGLYPRAVERHRQTGSDYRLIAGPVPTNAAAVQLCAKFVAARITCRAVKFDGERMVQR